MSLPLCLGAWADAGARNERPWLCAAKTWQLLPNDRAQVPHGDGAYCDEGQRCRSHCVSCTYQRSQDHQRSQYCSQFSSHQQPHQPQSYVERSCEGMLVQNSWIGKSLSDCGAEGCSGIQSVQQCLASGQLCHTPSQSD